MKKKLFSSILAFTLCLGLAVPAQAASAAVVKVFPPNSDNHYSDFRQFSEGVAVSFFNTIDEDRGWFFVDPSGKETTPRHYYNLGSLSEGLAAVQDDRNGAWGYIDRNGTMVVPFKYDSVMNYSACDFNEGMALVRSKETGKLGFINTAGQEVVPCKYDRAEEFSSGLALVYNAATAYYGYVDKTGQEVIPCQYNQAKSFEDGYAAVQTGSRWTIIDTTGRDLLPQQYTYQQNTWPENSFSHGAVYVTDPSLRNDNILFIDQNGQVISGGYRSVQNFSDGLAVVSNAYGFGCVNTLGMLVIPCQFSSIEPFQDGFAKAVLNSGNAYFCGIIDKTGQTVGVVDQDQYGKMKNASGGFFSISSNESGRTRMGFIHFTGAALVPCQYAQVRDFCGGFAAVENFEGKWGFVNIAGQEVVPCQYNEVSDFVSGIAVVVKENKSGLIDASGQEILPCFYQSSRFTSLNTEILENGISEGYITARSDDGWSIIAITP